MSGAVSAQRAAQLALLAQAGEASALEELTEAELPLVKFVASRFSGRGAEMDDLIQIGCIGLLKAAQRFDPAFGAGFSTYAFTLIEGEIRRALRDEVSTWRGRRREPATGAKIDPLEAWAKSDPPVNTELAGPVSRGRTDIRPAPEAPRLCLPLDSPHAVCRCDPSSGEWERGFERMLLSCLIEKLTPREREVVRLRYYNDMTQKEAAAVLGSSQAGVSRAEKRALNALRAMMGEEKR